MRKGKGITISIFLLSFGVTLGGWHLTRALLEWRQTEFLAKRGEILMQTSEMALLSVETQENAAADAEGNAFFQGEALTEEMRAEVLGVWENGGRVIPHEPRAGQMNMEQAIKAGEQWIAVMAKQGILPSEATEKGFDHITARLCTLEAAVDFNEDLLSYWSVQFLAEDLEEKEVEVRLTIHAISGEVWIAKVQMEDFDNLSEKNSLEDLLESAFSMLEPGKEIILMQNYNIVCEPMSQKLVYACAKEYGLQQSGKKPALQLEFWLATEEGILLREDHYF